MTSWNVRELANFIGVQPAHHLKSAEGFTFVSEPGTPGANLFSEIALGLGGVVTHVVTYAKDRVEKRWALKALSAMDDRMLADIGIERYEIKGLVYGEPAGKTAPSFWQGLTQKLAQARQRRAAIQALKRLPDHLLADIGIERHLIEVQVEGLIGTSGPRAEPPTTAAKPAVTAGDKLRQWDLSRKAAGEMARLDPELLADLGYVKGDIDWVPEVLAERQVATANANHKARNAA